MLWAVLLHTGFFLVAAPQEGLAFVDGRAAARGRVIVILDSEHRDQASMDTLSQMGLSLVFKSQLVPGLLVMEKGASRGAGPAAAVQVDPSLELMDLIRTVRATGFCESVEPDYVQTTSGMPAESTLASGDLWGLNNTGVTGGLKTVDVGALSAWAITSGASNVVVAVIDSGIQADHPDLAANLWRNPQEIPGNGIDDDNNGYVDDDVGVDLVDRGSPMSDPNGHGTHVAGTIAGVADNGYPGLGVAWNARVLPIRAGDRRGGLLSSLILEGMEYAATNPAQVRVVNASFGGYLFSEASYRMLAELGNRKILVVCAAGNEENNNDEKPSFPASYRLPNVLSVAALKRDGSLASFSNYGAESVHVAAPGEAILSSVPGSMWGENSGTSMAAPHVSGICALILSIYPNASVVELRQRVLQSIIPLPGIADKLVAGGIARADRAFQIGPDGALEVEITPVSARRLVVGRSNLVEVSISDVLPRAGGQLRVLVGSDAGALFTDDGTGPDRLAKDGLYTGYLIPITAGRQPLRLGFDWNSLSYSMERRIDVEGGPSNDDFARAQTIDAPSGGETEGTLLGARMEPQEPDGPSGCSVWYRWTTPGTRQAFVAKAIGKESSMRMDIYSGDSLGSLQRIAAESWIVDSATFLGFTNSPNQTLYFRVWSTNSIAGRFTFTFGLLNLASPSNDLRAKATEISDAVLGYRAEADSTGATREPDEPNHAGVPGGRSIWWKFTAPARGRLTVDTRGSGFDTVLAMYPSGSNTAVASNDDAGFGSQWSQATCLISEGDTMFIAVDGYGGASGRVTLNVHFMPDSNDAYAAANAISPGDVQLGSNVSATAEPREPAHLGETAGASVWYKWKAPSGGRATLTLVPWTSGLNLRAAVYATGNSALTSDINSFYVNGAIDSTSAGGQTLAIQFDAAAGQEYRIAIDGKRSGFLFPSSERGTFYVALEHAAEVGLLYRTGFEYGFDASIRPTDPALTGGQRIGLGALSGSYSLRLTPFESVQQSYLARLGGLDGFAYFETSLSFRYAATSADAAWAIGLIATPFSQDSFSNPTSDSVSVNGLGFSTKSGQGQLVSVMGGNTATTNLPAIAPSVIHSLILEADFAGSVLKGSIDANPSVRIPIRLPSANNAVLGPWFIFSADAGPLDIDNLQVRILPRRLGIQVPWMIISPTPKSVTAGQTIQLTATFGGPGLTYRWERNGVPLSDNERFSGSLTPSLSITPSTADAGYYRVVVSNDAGSAASTAALVTVTEQPVVDSGMTNILWRRKNLLGALIGPGNLVGSGSAVGIHGIDSGTGDDYWMIPYANLNLREGGGDGLVMIADDGALFLETWLNGKQGLRIVDDPCDLSTAKSISFTNKVWVRAVVGDARDRRVIYSVWAEDRFGVMNLSNTKRWERDLPTWSFLPLENHLISHGRTDATGYGVAAYDYDTGATKWIYPFGRLADHGPLGVPVWAGSRTILIAFSGTVIAIDSETGTEKWRRTVDSMYTIGILSATQGVIVGRSSQNPSWRYYTGIDPRTGEGIGPWFSTSEPFSGFEKYIITDGGGVVSGNREFRDGQVAWALPDRFSIVGISGNGRVILTDNYDGDGVSAIRGSGFPMSRMSPQPARLGEFMRPGSRGYLDGDLSRRRVGRGWARVKGGRLEGIDVFDGGMGYAAAPEVKLVGGGGSNAVAKASIDASGKVISIVVREPGSGYTNAPSVRFPDPDLPLFVSQPVSQTLGMGETVTLSAVVTNVAKVQWIKDGLPLPGATNATLTMDRIQPVRMGDYRIIASNALGSVTSRVATVAIRGVDSGLWKGLVGFYCFDGGTSDSGPFGNTGVGYGVKYRADRYGSASGALLLTNTTAVNSVVITNTLFRTGQEDFTVAAWMLLTDPAEADRVGTLFNTWPSPGIAMGFGTPSKPGEMRFAIGTGRAWRSVDAYPGIQDWTASRWRQVVLVKRGSVVRQYADGLLVTEGSVACQFEVDCGLLWGAAANLGIPGSVASNFYGAIDDARIYNRALSDSEVASLHGAELPPTVRILAQPQSVAALAGDRVSLVVGTTNALGHQWYRNGVPVIGGTNSTLILASIRVADAGSYQVVASNVMSSVTSDVAVVEVSSFPDFVAQPADVEVLQGGSVALAATVDAVPVASLQWYRDGVMVPGARGATLRLENVTAAGIGTYQLVASNSVGRVASREVRVSVTGADPMVWGGLAAWMPFSGTIVDEGAWKHPIVVRGAALTSDRRGQANAAVARNGAGEYIELPDHPALRADSYTLALWFNATRRAGAPGAVASETLISKGTGGAELSLGTATSGLGGIGLAPGGGAAWETAGAAYDTNRWHHLAAVYDAEGRAVSLYIDGVALPVAQAGSFALGLQATNGLRFGLRQDGAGGFLGRIDDIRVYRRALSPRAVRALVSLEAAAPLLVEQPADLRVNEGAKAAVSAVVVGDRPMSFAWLQAGASAAVRSETLELQKAGRSDSGLYKLVVTNAYGSATSRAFAIDVMYKPEFVILPTDKSVNPGTTVRLVTAVDGNPEPSLQWLKDGRALPGATNSTLNLGEVQGPDSGVFQLVASNEVGVATSRSIVVSVFQTPALGRQPADLTVDYGMPFELSVQASGNPAPTYQWSRGGLALPGATNATYRVASASSEDQGVYSVEVRNDLGSTRSAQAAVLVNRAAPVLTNLPARWEVGEGDDVVIAASVSSIPRATLQWLYEGSVLPGETNASLKMARVRSMEAGRYRLRATNVVGEAAAEIQLVVKDSGESLGSALDTGPNLVWPLPTATGWRRQTTVTHDGEDAAQSAPINGYQTSEMRLALAGPGTLTFWWRTSCEEGWDYAEVLLDGERKGRMTGIRNWAAVRIAVPAGVHSVAWRYTKDGSTDVGTDAAWVDEVEWSPEGIAAQASWMDIVDLSDGSLQVRSLGPELGPVMLESSDDLHAWRSLMNASPRNGVVRLRVDASSGGRFFRVR
jgi:subtilisin family serine protease